MRLLVERVVTGFVLALVINIAFWVLPIAAAPDWSDLDHYDIEAPAQAQVGEPFTVWVSVRVHSDRPLGTSLDSLDWRGPAGTRAQLDVAGTPFGAAPGALCDAQGTGCTFVFGTSAPLERGRYSVVRLTLTPAAAGSIELHLGSSSKTVVVGGAPRA